jgi:hypothetical protein
MEHEAIQLLDTLESGGNGSQAAAAQLAPGTRGITPPIDAA